MSSNIAGSFFPVAVESGGVSELRRRLSWNRGPQRDPRRNRNMSKIEQYKQYRIEGEELNNKLLNTRSDDELMEAARFLGMIVEEGGEEYLHHETELEMPVHADFAIHEVEREGKTGVERYYEAKRWDSEIEEEILEAMQETYTSLFRVESTNSDEGRLVLEDVLGQGNSPVELTDIGLSASAEPGALLFFRPVQIGDVTMTSGFMLPFSEGQQDHLVEVYEQTMEKTASSDDPKPESARRFYVFFRLHQKYGEAGMLM